MPRLAGMLLFDVTFAYFVRMDKAKHTESV